MKDINEQLKDMERLKSKVHIFALHKAAIVLESLASKMNGYTAKQEAQTLADSVRWAATELTKQQGGKNNG